MLKSEINPLSVDRVKLSEKLQSISPIRRLLIPEEFCDLALAFLNENSTQSDSVSDEIKDNSEAKEEYLSGNELHLNSQDFIIPPSDKSLPDPVLIVETRGKSKNPVKESKIDSSTATPPASGLNQVEDLEEWLDDLF